jgi:hypothetical protein
LSKANAAALPMPVPAPVTMAMRELGDFSEDMMRISV